MSKVHGGCAAVNAVPLVPWPCAGTRSWTGLHTAPKSSEATMDNERLKIWIGFVKFLLGTVILGLVTTFVNNEIQNREIELKEIEQLGKFIDHALTEDVGVRKRFAHYFSKVTRSERLRERWSEYYADVEKEFLATQEKKQKIEERLASNEKLKPEVRANLVKQAAVLEEALKPIPSQRGEQVLQAQKILIALGYSIDSADGFAGPQTRSAVKDFQSRSGLRADGMIGAATYDRLVKERENILIREIKEKIKKEGKINKISLIKWIRSETGWGLKDSKEFVDGVLELDIESENK
ncbi:peptidoglycan-binding protein [Desulfospira joergensenii]|uniref:peptidoglycan-binding protein n=1 Tax=Desulfospira joergensenii TaxID=53329 RepID=UPI00137876A2|nr:peptidoglycan-binding protein [Desulfospira joergensenii]